MQHLARAIESPRCAPVQAHNSEQGANVLGWGGCCKLISHSRCGLELGQALLLAAAVDEVMGLLVAMERAAVIALRQPESLNGNQRIAMP